MAQVKCEHCGTMNSTDDGFCVNCWQKLPEGVTLEGIGKRKWTNFVGKKNERYFKIFSRNKGKKIFFSKNWAACFLGFRWMLYRKMYLFTIIGMLAIILLESVVTVSLTFAHREEIKELTYTLNQPGKYDKEKSAANVRLGELELEILTASAVPILLVPLVLVFFGDALYKMHVKKNINSPDKGGTCLLSGLLLGSFISWGCQLMVIPLQNIAIGWLLN